VISSEGDASHPVVKQTFCRGQLPYWSPNRTRQRAPGLLKIPRLKHVAWRYFYS